MPRPITKDDIKRWRDSGWTFRAYAHDKLGWYIVLSGTWQPSYAYATNLTDGYPSFCSNEVLAKRKKIGHPKPRRKPKMMRDISMFSFDEIEKAMKVMEELG